jgi:hypothetical protein
MISAFRPATSRVARRMIFSGRNRPLVQDGLVGRIEAGLEFG